MTTHHAREESDVDGARAMGQDSGWTDLSTQQSEVRLNSGGMAVSTPNADQPQFLTVEEVAGLLRLKTRTIYEMVSQGRIPFRKAGRRTLFDREEIIAWTARPQTSPEPGRPDSARGSMAAPFRRRLQFGKGK
jgi:excisionase family DNA binding protein